MEGTGREEAREEEIPVGSAADAERLLDLIGAGWVSQAVHVAARLELADLLAEGPQPAEELAAQAGVHAPSLLRLLRALTSVGVCLEHDDGSFSMTAVGALLGSGPRSLRAWAIWWGTDLWRTWGHLLDSVETGTSARALHAGSAGFEHLERDAGAAAVFHEAMAELTRLEVREVLGLLDLDGARRVVDVGGGSGELLVAVLGAHPGVEGVLLDQPHAIVEARTRLDDAGLSSRCELVEGDFFERVPAHGDTYVLKSVVHDWDDEQAAAILATCRDAMAPAARLLLVERIVADHPGTSAADRAGARSDLTMLVAQGGRERTEAELGSLLERAGYEVVRITRSAVLGVIEARPRP